MNGELYYIICLVSIALLFALLIPSIYADPPLTTGHHISLEWELQSNNFTLSYGETGVQIEPTSYESFYDSGTNNLTTISCGTSQMGGCISHTSKLTDEQEEKLIDIIGSRDLLYYSFSSDACSSRACAPAHLIVNVPSLNKTNTYSWTKESSDTLENLNAIQQRSAVHDRKPSIQYHRHCRYIKEHYRLETCCRCS